MLTSATLFLLQATLLLGSPGPGIAALMAAGKHRGVRGGLPFFLAMQAGLALAVIVSAAGLFAVVSASPLLTTLMTVLGAAYLLFLAWSIATAPVGQALADQDGTMDFQLIGGFLLGAANPKAYLAFAALLASSPILPTGRADLALKSALCIGVMVVVDLAWLWAGAGLNRLGPGPRRERAINIVMGAVIAVAAAHSLLSLRS